MCRVTRDVTVYVTLTAVHRMFEYEAASSDWVTLLPLSVILYFIPPDLFHQFVFNFQFSVVWSCAGQHIHTPYT